MHCVDSERRLLGDQNWKKDYNNRRRWCGPASGEELYKNTPGLSVCALCSVSFCENLITYVLMLHVTRLLPWQSKRPSSSIPTCWWQKQWLSGKQSLPLRSCSTDQKYVTALFMWVHFERFFVNCFSYEIGQRAFLRNLLCCWNVDWVTTKRHMMTTNRNKIYLKRYNICNPSNTGNNHKNTCKDSNWPWRYTKYPHRLKLSTLWRNCRHVLLPPFEWWRVVFTFFFLITWMSMLVYKDRSVCRCSPDGSPWLHRQGDSRESSSCVPPAPHCSMPTPRPEDSLPHLCTHYDVQRLVPWSSKMPLLSFYLNRLCLSLSCSVLALPSPPSSYGTGNLFYLILGFSDFYLITFCFQVKWCKIKSKTWSHICCYQISPQ